MGLRQGRTSDSSGSLCWCHCLVDLLDNRWPHNKEILCVLFLAFYLLRLIQFLLKTSLALNMAQSNFVCLGLAVIGTLGLFSQNLSLPAKLSCLVLIADACLGAAIFVSHNQEGIYQELGLYKEYKKMK